MKLSFARAFRKKARSRRDTHARRRRRQLGRTLRAETLERRDLMTTVNVFVSDALAAEQPDLGGQTNPGQFRISRSDTSADWMSVDFELSGVAEPGSDYQASPSGWYDYYTGSYRGSVTFQPGHRYGTR